MLETSGSREMGALTLRLGEIVPDFDAITTQGPLKLSALRDDWVVLWSYAADFQPVAATEFLRFAELYFEFQRRTCHVVALSCDSLSAHIAWVRDLENISGKRIPFQVIADGNQRLARALGIIHPLMGEQSTISATFILDPQRVLRALMFYPPSTGRSVTDILRTVEALQVCDVESVDTPADWQPGEPALVPVPRTQESADRRQEEDTECVAWYLCRRPLK